MGAPLHRFTVSDRLHEERVTAHVRVYATRAELHAAAHGFNGNAHDDDTRAVTQAYANRDDTWVLPIVRVHLDVDGTVPLEVLVHEMHHASTAIYGTLPRSLVDPLTHYNEPFAYLHSNLVMGAAHQLRRRSIELSM